MSSNHKLPTQMFVIQRYTDKTVRCHVELALTTNYDDPSRKQFLLHLCKIQTLKPELTESKIIENMLIFIVA